MSYFPRIASRRGVAIVGAITLLSFVGMNAGSFLNTASALEPNNNLDCSKYTTDTGNVVLDEGSCLDLNYVPDVAGASAEGQRIALGLFKGTMEVCANLHTEAQVKAAGYSQSDGETLAWQHYDGDFPQTITDVNAMIKQSSNPPDLVVRSELKQTVQTMFSGKGFANLGGIPQLHDHRGEKWEMLHINCLPTIEEAFSYGGFKPTSTDAKIFRDALAKANSGGIAAVSSQIAAKSGAKTPTAASTSEPKAAAKVPASATVRSAAANTRPAVTTRPATAVPTRGTIRPAGSPSATPTQGLSSKDALVSQISSMDEEELEALLKLME